MRLQGSIFLNPFSFQCSYKGGNCTDGTEHLFSSNTFTCYFTEALSRNVVLQRKDLDYDNLYKGIGFGALAFISGWIFLLLRFTNICPKEKGAGGQNATVSAIT